MSSHGDDDIPSSLGAPARRALAGAGYTTLTQVASMTEQQLLRLHGMGPKAIRQLRAALAERDLTLADQET
ncbi:hypothetical protein SAMN05216276_109216 [Streptosporangium subroseum]|uniref:Helix-hairpin-helix domain-containing protein n=1 Tax=Streptosporangium subroseum TaxID=106412 RepID=A0A239P688_9ACTN|nr:helix-hairpin-helix domain-containing protein [Streptosporangium subroseum]SNT62596.1 hypothetical protein SAMN05216276_109216 [Streptosporangium subroseum]